MNKKILLTGLPHSGKSFLLNRLLERVQNKQGFLTLEVLKDRKRKGFKMVTARGTESLLAGIDFETSYKISKYFVSLENLEKIIPELENFSTEDILYIDEIGQMELLSEKFKTLVEKYLRAENIFIGTISKVYSDDFTQDLLSRNDIRVMK